MRRATALLLSLTACARPEGAAPPAGPALDGACAKEGPPAWVVALRAPPPAETSAFIARGGRFDDLRAGLDASLLPPAGSPPPPVARSDSASFVGASNTVLRRAARAFADADAALARDAASELAALAGPVDLAWLEGDLVDLVTHRVGGGLVSLAQAADLLAALLTPAALAPARTALRSAALAYGTWARSPVPRAFLALGRNNHAAKVGAALVATALVLAPTPGAACADCLDDAGLIADGLAWLAFVLDGGQTRAGAGWAEGTGYFAFTLESAGPALLAVDQAWPLAGPGCLPCPFPGLCGEAGALFFPRPREHAPLREALLWAASLVTRGGWLFPLDDARQAAPTAALYDLLLGERVFGALPRAAPEHGPFGASSDLRPFAAIAAARANTLPTRAAPIPAAWPLAGTAVVRGETSDGPLLEALLVGEHGFSIVQGGGHEKPDALALSVAADGVLLLGGSGYARYSERSVTTPPATSTLITVEGTLPGSAGPTYGPDASVDGDGATAFASTSFAGVTLSRAISLAPGEVRVLDRIALQVARRVDWHWHVRGDAESDGRRFRAGGLAAELVLPPMLDGADCRTEAALGCDVGQSLVPHPVLRCGLTLEAGAHDFAWTLRVSRP